MFDELKKKLGFFVLKRKFLKNNNSVQNFNNFIRNSKNYIFILPMEDDYFNDSFEVIKYFQKSGKNITLFLLAHKVNSFNINPKYNYISYSFVDINKIGLPSKSFIQKFSASEFDVLIDLQPTYDLFLSAIVSSTKAEYKVGVQKEKLNNLYNFNLKKSINGTEISYKNLLNSLKMF